MATIRLKYIIKDVDRHGTVRCYVRMPNRPKVRLREKFGSPEFFAEYKAALEQSELPARKDGPNAISDTVKGVRDAYVASAAFQALDVKTRQWRRRCLDDICRFGFGDGPIAELKPRHIRTIRDLRPDSRTAGNSLLAAIKALCVWACEHELIEVNPAAGVKAISSGGSGYHTWTPEEIAVFEARFAIGTTARLALALLLYTACRREDVIRLGPQHIRLGRLQYRQAKNEHRKPIDIDMMVPAELAKVIAGTPASGHLTFLVTEYGKPFTLPGMSTRMRSWVRQAGLPAHCTAHGLRKASATRLAEAGATAHEIMAVTGHQTLGEAERYTKAARKRGLADAGIHKLQNKE